MAVTELATLAPELISKCVCDIYVSGIQFVGNPQSPQVLITVSYNSTFNIKGYQLDFNFGWLDKLEFYELQPVVPCPAGTPEWSLADQQAGNYTFDEYVLYPQDIELKTTDPTDYLVLHDENGAFLYLSTANESAMFIIDGAGIAYYNGINTITGKGAYEEGVRLKIEPPITFARPLNGVEIDNLGRAWASVNSTPVQLGQLKFASFSGNPPVATQGTWGHNNFPNVVEEDLNFPPVISSGTQTLSTHTVETKCYKYSCSQVSSANSANPGCDTTSASCCWKLHGESKDVDVTQQRKYVDETWQCVVDSELHQKIVAWDISGEDDNSQAIPNTRIENTTDYLGPRILCRVLGTLNSDFMISEKGRLPSIKEASESLVKAIAVTCDLALGIPEENWKPADSSTSLNNIIQDSIFNEIYDSSKDVKMSEAPGLVGVNHVADVVACQIALDKELTTVGPPWTSTEIVPLVICNLPANVRSPQYESGCITTELKCENSGSEIVLDVYALGSVPVTSGSTEMNTCEIGGYHVMFRLLNFPSTCDLDSIVPTIGAGGAATAGLTEKVQVYESDYGEKFIEIWAYPAWGNELSTIPPTLGSVKLTSISFVCTATTGAQGECEKMISVGSNTSTTDINSMASDGKIFAQTLVGENSYGKAGSRIWSGDSELFVSHGSDWTGDKTGDGNVTVEDYTYLIEEVLDGGFKDAEHDLTLDANADGESNVGDIISLIKWMEIYGSGFPSQGTALTLASQISAATDDASEASITNTWQSQGRKIVPPLCCDLSSYDDEASDQDGEIFKTVCGSLLELQNCQLNTDDKFNLSFTLKYSPSINKNLSGFEFQAILPDENDLSIGSVTVYGGDAEAATWMNLGHIYTDTLLNKRILKIAGCGKWEDVPDSSYPIIRVESGSGPTLINFTLWDVDLEDYDDNITDCTKVVESFLTDSGLTLWTNDDLHVAPTTWTGDYTGDSLIKDEDRAGVMVGVITDRNDTTSLTHEERLRTEPEKQIPSMQDVIAISNYIFSNNPAAGAGVAIPDKSNLPRIVPTIVCEDVCKVIWEPLEYEADVDDECILEFEPSNVFCVTRLNSSGTITTIATEDDAEFSRTPIDGDTLNFTLNEDHFQVGDCQPVIGDIIVEVQYKSSCNLAGVQFEIDRSRLPKANQKIKCVLSPHDSPAKVQNWVWKWDAKGTSNVIFGCIQPCCSNQDKLTVAEVDAALAAAQYSDLIEWAQGLPDICEESNQIPSTLAGAQLCWVVLDGSKQRLNQCPEPEQFGINKDKGVTFDRTGGLLSDKWVGDSGYPADKVGVVGALNQFDFASLTQKIIKNVYDSTFDVNGNTQLDVLDAVFLAKAIQLCLSPGPYSWSGLNDLYELESVAGDLLVNDPGSNLPPLATQVASSTTAKNPELMMPAYCCPDEELDCESDIKIKKIRCSNDVVEVYISYKSNENTVAGFQFDLSYDFTASEIEFISIDVTTPPTPYTVSHFTHKDVYNSNYVTRFIGTPYVNASAPFSSSILPPSNDVISQTIDQRDGVSFGLITFKGVDTGGCECPSTKFFIKPSQKHIATLSTKTGEIPDFIPYSGKKHRRKDGYFWTGQRSSSSSQRIYVEHSGMGLCQARLITNDLRRTIRVFPSDATSSSAFATTDYIWNGDTENDADRDLTDVTKLVQEALYNGILPSADGLGKYDYQLDANWDGKIDIADIVALYNFVVGIDLLRGKSLNIVPQYLCNKSDFNSCSRPNCCDAEPCGQMPYENLHSGLHLHFGPPLHVSNWSAFWTAENEALWSDLLGTIIAIEADAPFTLVDIRLCADGSDVKFINEAKIELNLPPGYSIKRVIPGNGFKSATIQTDLRSIQISDGPEGPGKFFPTTAITHDGGPLTLARVLIQPMLEETLCFDCGKIKTVITEPCCPSATEFDAKATKTYTAGDLVYGVKWFTEDGIPIEQVSSVNYKKDSLGVPILDSDSNIQWYLQQGSVEVLLNLVNLEECYEFIYDKAGGISGEYLFAAGEVPGYEPNGYWKKIVCEPITIVEWEGGTSVTTSSMPFQHTSIRKRVYECYEKEIADAETDPTRLRTLIAPGLSDAMKTLSQYYTNVTTNLNEYGQSDIGNFNLRYQQLQATRLALVSNAGFQARGPLGAIATPTRLFEGNLSFGSNVDMLRSQTSRRVDVLTFGPCHPCVSCCSPVAVTPTEYENYNNGQYFSNNDVDLYLEVVDTNTIDVKYCTNNRISFFQFGIKVNEGYDLRAIDEDYGVAINTTDYKLTLSKYNSRIDKKDVYVVTGQMAKDDCEALGSIDYIDCADGHSILARLHLQTDRVDEVIWSTETIQEGQESQVVTTIDTLGYSLGDIDVSSTFHQAYFILKEQSGGIVHYTRHGKFIYNHSAGTICWADPFEQNNGERFELQGYTIDSSGTQLAGLNIINLGSHPDNVTISTSGAENGIISVDGVPAFRLAAAHANNDALLIVDATYPGLYELGQAVVTPVSVTDTSNGTPVSLVSGKFTTNEFFIETTGSYNALRCPPLFPHDKCFSKQITNILCITKPLKFLTPGAKQLTGELAPWDASTAYVIGDKVHVDEGGISCYEYLCAGTEPCCAGGTAATATITFLLALSVGNTITIIDTALTSKTYTVASSIDTSANEFAASTPGEARDTLALCIAAAAGHNGTIIASAGNSGSSTGVLNLEQATGGEAGNTIIGRSGFNDVSGLIVQWSGGSCPNPEPGVGANWETYWEHCPTDEYIEDLATDVEINWETLECVGCTCCPKYGTTEWQNSWYGPTQLPSDGTAPTTIRNTGDCVWLIKNNFATHATNVHRVYECYKALQDGLVWGDGKDEGSEVYPWELPAKWEFQNCCFDTTDVPLWAAGTYAYGSMVMHRFSLWYVNQTTTTDEPGAGGSTDWWNIGPCPVAGVGDTNAIGGTDYDLWVTTKTYEIGDYVWADASSSVIQIKAYRAIQSVPTGKNPTDVANAAYWQEITCCCPCKSALPWDAAAAYEYGDGFLTALVSYNNECWYPVSGQTPVVATPPAAGVWQVITPNDCSPAPVEIKASLTVAMDRGPSSFMNIIAPGRGLTVHFRHYLNSVNEVWPDYNNRTRIKMSIYGTDTSDNLQVSHTYFPSVDDIFVLSGTSPTTTPQQTPVWSTNHRIWDTGPPGYGGYYVTDNPWAAAEPPITYTASTGYSTGTLNDLNYSFQPGDLNAVGTPLLWNKLYAVEFIDVATGKEILPTDSNVGGSPTQEISIDQDVFPYGQNTSNGGLVKDFTYPASSSAIALEKGHASIGLRPSLRSFTRDGVKGTKFDGPIAIGGNGGVVLSGDSSITGNWTTDEEVVIIGTDTASPQVVQYEIITLPASISPAGSFSVTSTKTWGTISAIASGRVPDDETINIRGLGLEQAVPTDFTTKPGLAQFSAALDDYTWYQNNQPQGAALRIEFLHAASNLSYSVTTKDGFDFIFYGSDATTGEPLVATLTIPARADVPYNGSDADYTTSAADHLWLTDSPLPNMPGVARTGNDILFNALYGFEARLPNGNLIHPGAYNNFTLYKDDPSFSVNTNAHRLTDPNNKMEGGAIGLGLLTDFNGDTNTVFQGPALYLGSNGYGTNWPASATPGVAQKTVTVGGNGSVVITGDSSLTTNWQTDTEVMLIGEDRSGVKQYEILTLPAGTTPYGPFSVVSTKPWGKLRGVASALIPEGETISLDGNFVEGEPTSLYDSTTSYTTGDVVIYQDECWTATQDGILDSPKEYSSAECCPGVVDYSDLLEYASQISFTIGDKVIHCTTSGQDQICVCYEALITGTYYALGTPNVSPPCCDNNSEWNSTTAYETGDQVWHDGDCWEAVANSSIEPTLQATASWALADCTPKWKAIYCDQWDKVVCDPSASGQVTIPIQYTSDCDNISGFSLKLTGVPDSFKETDAVLHGGTAATAGFIQKVYKDSLGNFWIVGVLTDLEKLLHTTSASGKLLTNITFYGGVECDNWTSTLVEACAARFVSNSVLTSPETAWTGTISAYVTTEDVVKTMDIIPLSWNNYQYEDPWSEFIDANYDGVIRIEDAVATMNHMLINIDDSGIVRPGVHGFVGARNTFYGVGGLGLGADRPNVIKRDPVEKNIVPQVCGDEEIFTNCLCPCDEPVEELCVNAVRLAVTQVTSGYFLTVYYNTSCCLDGYWVEFDGIKNVFNNKLTISPLQAAEPVKKKWLQYTGYGPDTYLSTKPLNTIPMSVIFGWAESSHITETDSITGAVSSVPACLPATDVGEEKILARVYVNKNALEHNNQGQPTLPTIKNFRLVTNEKKNIPAENWTGDVTGVNANGIISPSPDGKVGLKDVFSGVVQACVMGNTGTVVPELDAEGDGGHLDIVDILTIWNYYTSILPDLTDPSDIINGLAVPTPRPEIVPTDCCPGRSLDAEEVLGDFKVTVSDSVTDPSNHGRNSENPNSIRLSWTAVADATEYRVYRFDDVFEPIAVIYDPSVLEWTDLHPPANWSEDSTQSNSRTSFQSRSSPGSEIPAGPEKVPAPSRRVGEENCCSGDLIPIDYTIVAAGNSGERSQNMTAAIECLNVAPEAIAEAHSMCMDSVLNNAFRAIDDDVDTTGDGDTLTYTVIQKVGGSVEPMQQPGYLIAPFKFTPDPGFVGIAYIEFEVRDKYGCSSCAVITIEVRPDGVKDLELSTGDCNKLSAWDKVILSWTAVVATALYPSTKYNIYRRHLGADEWGQPVDEIDALPGDLSNVVTQMTYTDTLDISAQPSLDCTEGITYEYAVTAVVSVQATALAQECGGASECCDEQFKSLTQESQNKIKAYIQVDEQSKGPLCSKNVGDRPNWTQIARVETLIGVIGLSWYDVGFIDCCCSNSFRFHNNLSPAEENFYLGLDTDYPDIESILEEYLDGYNVCCPYPSEIPSSKDIANADGPQISSNIESCLVDHNIPTQEQCCSTSKKITIECCDQDMLCCITAMNALIAEYDDTFPGETDWIEQPGSYLLASGVSAEWIGKRDCCLGGGRVYSPVGEDPFVDYNAGFTSCNCVPVACTAPVITPSACGDADHPSIDIGWTEVADADHYKIIINKLSSSYTELIINTEVSGSSTSYSLQHSTLYCFCPKEPKTISISVQAIDRDGLNIGNICSGETTVPCCKPLMECPSVTDRTWYTNKNEIVIGQVPPIINKNPNCSVITYSLIDPGSGDTPECCPNPVCGPFNGTVYKKSDYPASPNAIDTNGEFVYVPEAHWVSEYDADGNPLSAPNGGPDSFTYKATNCCDESDDTSHICCEVIIYVNVDICNENDYVICDATIAQLSSQFDRGPVNPGQVPFSLNRRGGQSLRKTKRAYVVTKGANPLLDPDWS